MQKSDSAQPDLDLSTSEKIARDTGPVECLGLTFPDDKARREHFLRLLREGLTELHAKLGGVPFTTVEDAVERMRSVEKWPMGYDERLRELAERMRHGDSSKDLLQRWKDEVGFPHGEIEDILNLSDPPYYTACPNPFIADFIKHYGKPYDPNEPYSKEPFAADVSEGKNDPIYNAHSYHTKVPHKAIMRYILHYTEPGDVVFDGFSGTGMTGVAAQLCGDTKTIESLGCTVLPDGSVLNKTKEPFSKIGERQSVLSDLSPLATFIACNYTNFSNLICFTQEALELLAQAERALSWLCEEKDGVVASAIWSDVFLCPNCSGELVFWDAALRDGKMQDSFPCPHCGSTVGKSASMSSGATKLERPFDTRYDPILKKIVRVPKFVLVEQTIRSGSARHSLKVPPENRDDFLKRFEGRSWPAIPTDEFFPGRQTNKLINGSKLSHVCHMYTPRALFAYGYLWQLELSSAKHTALFRFCLSAINNYISRKQGYFGGGGGISGTLFAPSIHLERNMFDVLRRKIKKIGSLSIDKRRTSVVSTQNVTWLNNIPANTIDYIFTDPPFGESLQYAELNMFVEAWLKVKTVSENDCVLNYVHKKNLTFYSHMMTKAFSEYARVLKPGRWITIEFHNSQNAVWYAIQQAIEAAGFIVADVRILDKQQRSFNAVNRAGAVDQDLVITAYKPNSGLEDRFKLTAGTEESVWDFVRSHLKQLPVFVSKEGKAEVIVERQSHLLFDRMVAFHVQRGVTVPLAAAEFYAGLAQRFPERDGMYFLPDQVAEYDKNRMKVKEILQLQLFVTDESSAIQWLKQQLTRKPQTFQELHPQFLKEIGGWQKYEKPLELSDLLEQNFLCYGGKGPIPKQIVSWMRQSAELQKVIDELLGSGELLEDDNGLATFDPRLIERAKARWYVPNPNKAGDLEKLRERALLREFEEYRESTQKRLKVFRLEAVRAGFKKAWQERDYATIIAVARKIPENVLQEDPKLLMWYDQALTRIGGGR